MNRTSAEMIDLAVGIELECAALYEVYARCFAASEELRTFWGFYAEAERYHAASIRIHVAALMGAEPEGGDSAEVDPVEARTFLERLKQMRVDAERNPPRAAEAFGRAREIEEHSAELHGRTQFFERYPSLAELFREMAADDREHREKLSQAEKRWASL